MALDDILRLKSGRLGTEDWAEGAVGLISGLVDAADVVVDGLKAWFVLGAGDSFRETSERFNTSAGGAETADTVGISTEVGFDKC